MIAEMEDNKKNDNLIVGSVTSENYFHSDFPIEKNEQDLLGRSKFAQSIAQALSSRPKDGSLVVGLTGKWGEGKTSLVNLIKFYLEEKKGDIFIKDFPVWSLTSRDEIHDEFFAVIENAIGNSTTDKTIKKKAAEWRILAAKVSVIGSLIPYAIAFISLIVAMLSVWVTKEFGSFVSVMVSFSASVGTIFIAKWALFSPFFGKMAELLKVQSTVRQENLDDVKKELQGALRESKKTIIIVVDDIDRLAPEEVRLVFQLIKGNGDLPNIIYILPYDEVLLSKIIEKAFPNAEKVGPEYLDKIIQVRFAIPPPDSQKVGEVLIQRLNELLGPTIEPGAEAERWNSFSATGLFSLFQTLRDVNRFLNSFKLSFSLCQSGGQYEVNRVDLLILEIIKFFEPDAHIMIKTLKRELLKVKSSNSQSGSWLANDLPLQQIISCIKVAEREKMIRGLLAILFPQTQTRISERDLVEYRKSLRVAHFMTFDRYFSLTLPEREILLEENQQMMKAKADINQLTALFKKIADDGRLKELLVHLYFYAQEFCKPDPNIFLRSLVMIEDRFQFSNQFSFKLRPQDEVANIVCRFLLGLEFRQRVDVLKTIFFPKYGFYLPIHIASVFIKSPTDLVGIEGLPDSKNEIVALLNEVRAKGCEIIESHSKSKKFLSHPMLLAFLFNWRDWGGSVNLKLYLENVLLDPESTLSLLKSSESIKEVIGITPGKPSTQDPKEEWEYDHVVEIVKSVGLLPLLKKIPDQIKEQEPKRAEFLRNLINEEEMSLGFTAVKS